MFELPNWPTETVTEEEVVIPFEDFDDDFDPDINEWEDDFEDVDELQEWAAYDPDC